MKRCTWHLQWSHGCLWEISFHLLNRTNKILQCVSGTWESFWLLFCLCSYQSTNFLLASEAVDFVLTKKVERGLLGLRGERVSKQTLGCRAHLSRSETGSTTSSSAAWGSYEEQLFEGPFLWHHCRTVIFQHNHSRASSLVAKGRNRNSFLETVRT